MSKRLSPEDKAEREMARRIARLDTKLIANWKWQQDNFDIAIFHVAVGNDVYIVRAPAEPLADPVADDGVTGFMECYGERPFT